MAAKKAKRGTKGSTQQKPTGKNPGRKAKFQLRMELFVAEYLKDLNGRAAAIRAGYCPENARFEASQLLARPDVNALVEQAKAERVAATKIESQEVLERLHAIATADPRELIELYRGCCRYCYGKDHRYQRTPREMEDAKAQYLEMLAEAADAKKVPPFDTAGGLGWNPTKDPNPVCPECFGQGAHYAHPKDTRDLSPSARLLYAGVKETQHGIQVQMHDQVGALRLVGEHLGMFKKRIAVGGDPQNKTPIPVGVAAILDEIDGADTGLPKGER